MAKETEQKGDRKFFDEEERLLKEHPSLGKSYSQFRQDWEKYRELQKASKKKEAHNYVVFGASFRE